VFYANRVYARHTSILGRIWTSGDLVPFGLKISTLVTPEMGDVHNNCGFLRFFVFKLETCDRQID